jgi:hypothetical protein
MIRWFALVVVTSLCATTVSAQTDPTPEGVFRFAEARCFQPILRGDAPDLGGLTTRAGEEPASAHSGGNWYGPFPDDLTDGFVIMTRDQAGKRSCSVTVFNGDPNVDVDPIALMALFEDWRARQPSMAQPAKKCLEGSDVIAKAVWSAEPVRKGAFVRLQALHQPTTNMFALSASETPFAPSAGCS